MTNHTEQTNSGNPFQELSLRNLFLWLFLIAIILSVSLGIYISVIHVISGNSLRGFRPDPIFGLLAGYLFILISTLWIHRKCRQLKINVRLIFGKLAFNYSWPILIFVMMASLLFAKGSIRLSLGALSFIMPAYVENQLKSDIGLSSSLPTTYYWLNLFSVVVSPLFSQFLFQGIVLHGLTAKRSINRSIVILALFMGISFPYSISNAMLEIFYAIFYIQSRSLVVPIVAQVLNVLLSIIWKQVIYPGGSISLAEFRGQIWWGGLCLLFSTPALVLFIYKNWPSKHQMMPYFANAAQFNHSGAPE
jgi:hypothetical protein